MKSTLLFLCVFCFAACLQAGAQNVKLYGYVQKVTPGIRARVELDENGNRKKIAGKDMENYFLYLANPSKSRIYLVEGWIRGEQVGLKGNPVQTPVTVMASTETGETVEVVPKTTATVLQLTSAAPVGSKSFEKAKKLAQSNELVVVYKQNGRFRYATLKSFQQLEPGHMQ